MADRILRFEVPVDDQPHTIELTKWARPLQVGAVRDDLAEFWALHREGEPTIPRMFLVCGTGQPLPEGTMWQGTSPRTAGGFVWHLFELVGPL
jgi:hypothetical protein